MNINELMLDPKFDLEEYIENKDKEIERLSKEVDMWNRKYNEQIDIINELEKHLIVMSKIYEEEYKDIDVSEHYKSILNKLKELKENNK